MDRLEDTELPPHFPCPPPPVSSWFLTTGGLLHIKTPSTYYVNFTYQIPFRSAFTCLRIRPYNNYSSNFSQGKKKQALKCGANPPSIR